MLTTTIDGSGMRHHSKSRRSLQQTDLLLNTTEVLLAVAVLPTLRDTRMFAVVTGGNMIYSEAREHDFDSRV